MWTISSGSIIITIITLAGARGRFRTGLGIGKAGESARRAIIQVARLTCPQPLVAAPPVHICANIRRVRGRRLHRSLAEGTPKEGGSCAGLMRTLAASLALCHANTNTTRAASVTAWEKPQTLQASQAMRVHLHPVTSLVLAHVKTAADESMHGVDRYVQICQVSGPLKYARVSSSFLPTCLHARRQRR